MNTDNALNSEVRHNKLTIEKLLRAIQLLQQSEEQYSQHDFITIDCNSKIIFPNLDKPD